MGYTNYIKLFKNEEEYDEFQKSKKVPWHNISAYDSEVFFNDDTTKEVSYKELNELSYEYLTIVNRSEDEVKLNINQNLSSQQIIYSLKNNGEIISYNNDINFAEIYYKVNNTEWQLLSKEITINPYDEISLKSNCNKNENTRCGNIKLSGNGACIVKGNIMSLVYGDEFIGKTDLSGYDYIFENLFKGNTSTLIDVYKLILPCDTLSSYCYKGMFEDCKTIKKAPILSAKELVKGCYSNIFNGCCSLNQIIMLATDVSANECLDNWINGISAKGQLIKHPLLINALENEYDSLKTWSIDGFEKPKMDYSNEYFTIHNIGTSSLSIRLKQNATYQKITYKLSNSEEWIASNASIILQPYEKVEIRASLTPITNYGIGTFNISSTSKYRVYGNIMSLLFDEDFIEKTDLSGYNYAFNDLFYNCTTLVNASELILPATILSNNCYSYMFHVCTSLTEAPKLLATTLASGCYNHMFNGCTSLVTAPELLATTLVNYCYNHMFYGCSKLNNITMLATNISASNCLFMWVYGIASSGTFTKHHQINSLESGVSGIPSKWKVEDYNKYLHSPFTIYNTSNDNISIQLIQNNIGQVLNYKTSYSDNWIKTKERIILKPNESVQLKGVCKSENNNGIGTFSINGGPYEVYGNVMSLVYGDYFKEAINLTNKDYIFKKLFNDNINLTNASNLTLPATVLSNGCYESMFYGCTSLTSAPELLAETLTNYCYQGMFENCTSLTEAPELKAVVLSNGCYESMFYGCTSLSYIKMIAKNFAENSLTNWVYGVSSDGTFIKDKKMNSLENSNNGIPNDWEVENYCDEYYFTIQNITENELSIKLMNGTSAQTLSYRVEDSDKWIETNDTITLQGNKEVSLKGTLTPSGTTSIGTFNINGGTYEVYGNIMSLLYNDDFYNKKSITKAYTFAELFNGCSNLIDATDLCLLATTVANACYHKMFNGCNKLQSPPIKLPSNTLVYACYNYMFANCTALEKTPKILATKLAQYSCQRMFSMCKSLKFAQDLFAIETQSECCQYMFEGCTSLISAPKLPATTLANWCYRGMFQNCTSLTSTPELPAITLASSCYYGMFYGCTSLETAPALPATTLANSCYATMFQNCTSLTTAPELPATTLKNYCYNHMFNGCTSLVTAPELLATTLAYACYANMFQGCSNLVNGPSKLLAENVGGFAYNSMFRSCTSLVNAPEILATTLSSGSCQYMFTGCASLIKGPSVLSATTLNVSCYDSMFSSCSKLTEAPDIITDTMEINACTNMFNGCKSLTTAPALPATTLANSCYQGMFQNCTSLTTAPELPATTLASSCYRAMFNGTNALPDCSNIDFTDGEVLSSGGLNGLFYGTKVTEDYLINNTNIPRDENGSFYLPLDVLTPWCYQEMFNNCSNLDTSFDLVATQLAEGCYYSMFNGTNVMPNLSGIDFANESVVASGGMRGLFYGTKITDAYLERILPKDENNKYCLPATTLTSYCYERMFYACKSLVTAPEIKSTTVAPYCCQYMFAENSKLQKSPSILLATTLAECCYLGMFYQCNILKTAPELPATTLASSCYGGMFMYVYSLSLAPELPATTLANSCYSSMFYATFGIKESPILHANTLVSGCYKQMFYYSMALTKITMLATNISASNCLSSWVGAITRKDGIFIKNKDMLESSFTRGANGIPSGWSVEDYEESVT